MKKLIPFAVVSLSLVAGSHAAPFMAIGDGAELFLTGSLAVRYDDNILLTGSGEQDDLIFEISPGAELTFGKDAQLKGALTANVAFAIYDDRGEFNTTLAGADFVAHYDDGKLRLGFNVGYHELNQNSADIQGLTRRDVWSAGGNAELEVSQLTSVAAGVQFNHEKYKRSGFTDSDSYTIPVSLYYKWTPKVDASFGYRYRDYLVDLGDDSSDHFFSLGARGDFSPKLTGTFSAGLNNRKLSGGGDDAQLGLDASFAYEITPKTSLQVGATNDFGTSPQGQQQKNLTLRAALSTRLNEQWSLNGNLSYRRIEYTTRTDDFIEGGLGATYNFDANVTVVGGYVHREYDSALPGGDFSNNVFSLAANFRY